MTALMPVEAAQARLLALAAPLASVTLPLADAHGRFLASPLIAQRSQPAAPLSAMDGYAIRFADLPGPWRVTGAVAAGQPAAIALGPGEAIRIFTGAVMPPGADTVLVQEDARTDGADGAGGGMLILHGDGPASQGQHMRTAASDFAAGTALAAAGALVSAPCIALAAMAGHGTLTVGGAPRIALLATGDELVPPGAPLGPAQIPDSNGVMLAAMLAALPGTVSPPQRIGDDRAATTAAIAAAASHDIVVTLGGASVGAHDHVHATLTALGAPPDFWRVAMRPGKPVMAARLGQAVVVGLPGNPASAFVTAMLFLLPLVRHLAGAAAPFPPVQRARLATGLAAGGARRDYLRATVADGLIAPAPMQDSGLLTPLAAANALLIRDSGAPARAAGEELCYLAL